MEIDLCTLADRPAAKISHLAEQRTRDLMEEIELADQVGLDVFDMG